MHGRWRVIGIVILLVGAVAALTFAGLVASARDEVPAGPKNWDVSARYSHLEPEWGGSYGAWVMCDIEIRSKEVPACVLRTENGAFLGWHGQVQGGIHDWVVFWEMDSWPRARRIALLKYLVAEGNPLLGAAQDADKNFWYWAVDEGYSTLPETQTVQIAVDKGVDPDTLMWVSTGSDWPFRNEIVGTETSSGAIVRVTP